MDEQNKKNQNQLNIELSEEIAQGLRHLLLVDEKIAVVNPVFREGLSRGGLGLGDLVFMVGKGEVSPSRMDIEG